MNRIEIRKPKGFSLAAASKFYAGFTPGSGMAAAATDRLTLAFRLDRTFEPVAVALSERDSVIELTVAGTHELDRVAAQVARILGLEAGAEDWLELGRRDPIVGALQREFPGFFTAAKSSPYDAAAWAMISSRIGANQAAAIKLALARELGDGVELEGRRYELFPAPSALSALESFPGLSAEKVVRLRGVGEAARSGLLDAEYLRALGETRALAELQTLRGVGPWVASHIYFRGAAPTDGLPLVEPRVLHGFSHAYRLESATFEMLAEYAEAWRPFRMWVCVLFSRHLARIGAWHAPTLTSERAAAGRALSRRAQTSLSWPARDAREDRNAWPLA